MSKDTNRQFIEREAQMVSKYMNKYLNSQIIREIKMFKRVLSTYSHWVNKN